MYNERLKLFYNYDYIDKYNANLINLSWTRLFFKLATMLSTIHFWDFAEDDIETPLKLL